MKYAVLGYSTINIGDDIQSLVTSTLLDIDYIIMRDDYEKVYDIEGNTVELNETVKLIMNGWFMHDPNWESGNNNIKFPIKNEKIIPIYISTCLSKDVKLLFSEKCIENYKKFQPVLCRDNTTLSILQKKGVDVEFFGCLTQLLEDKNIPENKKYEEIYKDSVIYIDCKKEYSKRKKNEKNFFFRHYINEIVHMNPRKRIDYAKDLLSKYKYAKKIYSSRLHAFLPCRAMGLNVVYTGDINYRVKDLVSQKPDRDKMKKIFYDFV